MSRKLDNHRGKETILVVDDQTATLEVLQRNLVSQGYQVLTAAGATEAIEILEAVDVDLVITDYKMPKISGLDLIRHVRENYRQTEVMMITGYASINGAVKAVKAGAEEYIAKPFTDKELFDAVENAITKLNIRKKQQNRENDREAHYHGLIGNSAVMKEIYKTIAKAARTTATVLITGESGTGKELVARAIHYNSSRVKAPFVPINCGGIPESLLESELFGYVKGAFTGATESRAGFFQTADGGSIFLDEISETSLTMQVKLLRVLQDKEVCMVGATQTRKVNVRIMAATNKELHSLVKKQIFREDLYFRLNVITIIVPPLRERDRDVITLAQHFAEKFAKELDKRAPRLSSNILDALCRYDWPGNVRELENVIQRMVVMSDADVLEMPDLPGPMRFSVATGPRLDQTLAEVESEHIRNVMTRTGGNKSHAAKILGIDRKTLLDKIKKAAPE
ncbi:MAG: sigma-54 dependent transcriptional regulator [bacterium]|nr:sigma-54 dependent transcriptional regulator [bacterium]